MFISNLPFHIGASSTSHNPKNIPDTYPIEIYYDEVQGIIRQKPNPGLLEILEDVYSRGLSIGTQLNEHPMAASYVDDFLDFVNRAVTLNRKLRILEVGAGTGFLSRRLMDIGHDVTAIEPGKGYASYWERYSIEPINDFFPSPSCVGPYDLIVSYLVLEHISDPLKFICDMKSTLSNKGLLVFAVPDETEEIQAGDPNMLFHKHFNYFDVNGLRALLACAGLSATIETSKYGRCLYSYFAINSDPDTIDVDRNLKLGYFDKVSIYKEGVKKKIRSLLELGSSLVNRPVDNLVIIARTFGSGIMKSLVRDGYNKNIVLMTDLV